MSNATLGFIGLGLMGAPIALTLCKQAGDSPLRIWGRNPERLAPLRSAGAVETASPAELAADCDIVFLCVTDTAAVESVVFGESGVAAGAVPGKVLVDHSSIQPEATRRLAKRLRDESGMDWLDAPVSGGASGVQNKTLAVMAGGEQTVYDRIRPFVMEYAGRFTLMGPIGSGQSTKLINQALCGAGFLVVAEATRLALDAGIAVDKIPEALAGGRADSRLLQEFMPHMANANFEPRGRIDIMLKDLQTVADFARGTGTPMPMISTATELHRLLVAQGLGAEDNAAVIKLLEQRETK